MRMKYFAPEEFRCRCGCGFGIEQMDPRILGFLEAVRERVGRPFKINSAVRCAKHNANVQGARLSEHVPENTDSGLCTGVDIHCPDSAFTYALLREAFSWGIPRIGLNFAKSFAHIGVSTKHPQEVLFKY